MDHHCSFCMDRRGAASCAKCGLAPYEASDLDFFEGMSPKEVKEWRVALLGEEHKDGQFYRETLAWIDSLKESAEFAIDERDMLVDAFSEALSPACY
jgi:hypothetical protein